MSSSVIDFLVIHAPLAKYIFHPFYLFFSLLLSSLWPAQEMDLYRYSAAFPELVIPVLGHLKKFAKLTKVGIGDPCRRSLSEILVGGPRFGRHFFVFSDFNVLLLWNVMFVCFPVVEQTLFHVPLFCFSYVWYVVRFSRRRFCCVEKARFSKVSRVFPASCASNVVTYLPTSHTVPRVVSRTVWCTLLLGRCPSGGWWRGVW